MAIEYLNTNLNAEDDFCNGSCSCASTECEGEAPVPQKTIYVHVHGVENPLRINGSDAVNALYEFNHGNPIQHNGSIIPYESINYIVDGVTLYQIINNVEDVTIPSSAAEGATVTATYTGSSSGKIVIYQSGTSTVIAQNDSNISSGGTLSFTMPASDVSVDFAER